MTNRTSKSGRAQVGGDCDESDSYDQIPFQPPRISCMPFRVANGKPGEHKWRGRIPRAKTVCGAFEAGGLLADLFLNTMADDCRHYSDQYLVSTSAASALAEFSFGAEGEFDNRHRLAIFFYRRICEVLVAKMAAENNEFTDVDSAALVEKINAALSADTDEEAFS